MIINYFNIQPHIEFQNKTISASLFNQFDEEYIRPDGIKIWLQIITTSLKSQNSDTEDTYLIEIEDITLRKDYEDQIHELAYHDALTQLPNRRLLMDRVEQAIVTAYRHHNLLGILFLDIDYFKHVNDTLGHDIGDELLKAIAARVTALLRQQDTIARISGDEFVILLNGISSSQDPGIVAEKILERIKDVFLISGHIINISGSIGIAIYPQHGQDTTQILKNADQAMYQAKNAGKNQYRYVE
jgi:diguanylate cyclase (GGDEF)-like protein